MEFLDRALGLPAPAWEIAVLLAAGWLVTHLAERRARGRGLPSAQVERGAFWLSAGAVAGARLPFVFLRLEAYLAHPLDILRPTMGLSLYGALAGALLVLGWFAWRTGLPFWPMGDSYALYVPLGIGLYRLACLARGDCFGRQAPPPFGVVFPGLTQPRFPAELYEAGLALALFGSLWWLGRRRQRAGTLLVLFLLLYPLGRTFVDATRIDVSAAPLSHDQVVSLAIASATGVLLPWWRRVTPGPATAHPGSAYTLIAREESR